MSTMFAVPPRPALFTATSIRPCSATAVSKRRWTSASCVTSAGTPSTPSSLAVSSRRRSCLSLMTTVAPSWMQRLAVARPMPAPAAAVMRTILPCSNSCAGGGSGIGCVLLARKHRTVLGRSPECRPQSKTAFQPDVEVVFPRESDAAVALQRLGIGQGLGARSCNLRHACRFCCVVRVVRQCVRRVPGRGSRVFDRDVDLSQLVLHRLERSDGTAELLARGDVFDRGFEEAHG